QFDCSKFIDIMWYLNPKDIDMNKIIENDFLVELYNAKGYLSNLKHSNNFDFDILMLINKHEHKINATLDFEYICSSCKHSFPIFETRCPHCHQILTFNVKHHLTKALFDTNQSLQ
ncbi:MAG: tetratricopeptide repeat protein, partial [Erysipelotrichia bacterium]|nr:tetratricopeptide repeat protein [Erysipelotrichia bacterium]